MSISELLTSSPKSLVNACTSNISFLLILVRLIIGKTTFDRILAANSIGTIIVLAISVHGFYMGRPEFIDISIVYALINFIGTVAVLKLFDKGTLGDK